MTYPEGALVVVGMDARGNLGTYPEGGEDEFIIPQSDLPRFSVLSSIEAVPIYRRICFSDE